MRQLVVGLVINPLAGLGGPWRKPVVIIIAS